VIPPTEKTMTEGPVRILIADDNEFVRHGIRALLGLRSNWEVCGEAVDGVDAVRQCQLLKPDIVLLDITMPNLGGLEAARIIQKDVPKAKVLFVSQHDAAFMVQRSMETGARGYIVKSELSQQLLAAVDGMLQGTEAPVSSAVSPAEGASRNPSQQEKDLRSAVGRIPEAPGGVSTPSPIPDTNSQAEVAEAEKDKEFRIMADIAPAMIWLSGPDTLRTYFNRPWLEFTGRSLEQELGDGWTQGIHPEDRGPCLEQYRSSVRECKPFKLEYRLRRADGKYRWVLSHVVPRLSDAGLFDGYVGSVMDITERKAAEETSSRLAAIVQSSDDAIIAKDLRGVITSWNASAERIFGYSSEEVIGKPITIVIPPELQKEEEQILRRLMAGQRIEHFETVRVTKHGKRINVSLTISPVKDSSGRIVGASKIARDITRLKQVEEALRDSEQRMRYSLEAASFGTWNWDIASGKVHWSDNMEKIHGQPPGSFSGSFEGFVEGICVEDRRRVQDAIQKALGGEGKYEVEYRQFRADGALSWMESHGQVIYDESKRPTAMIGVCWDITERKQNEDELKQAHEQLEVRVRERTSELERAQERLRMLSGRLLRMQDDERRRIARELHDTVGQLVVALNLNLVPVEEELLQKDPALAKQITESLSLVEELSRDLRTISHLLHPPLLDEAGLQSALRWFVDGFSERSKIEVDLRLDPALGRLPAEHETAIFRIVQECLTNIHRHSGSRTASIDISRKGDHVEVEIRDQGKGMPRPAPRAGVGIQGMGERLHQLGGSLDVASTSSGTRVLAILPAGDSSFQLKIETVDVAS
jgi:PAS domain S-box-containing protein